MGQHASQLAEHILADQAGQHDHQLAVRTLADKMGQHADRAHSLAEVAEHALTYQAVDSRLACDSVALMMIVLMVIMSSMMMVKL